MNEKLYFKIPQKKIEFYKPKSSVHVGQKGDQYRDCVDIGDFQSNILILQKQSIKIIIVIRLKYQKDQQFVYVKIEQLFQQDIQKTNILRVQNKLFFFSLIPITEELAKEYHDISRDTISNHFKSTKQYTPLSLIPITEEFTNKYHGIRGDKTRENFKKTKQDIPFSLTLHTGELAEVCHDITLNLQKKYENKLNQISQELVKDYDNIQDQVQILKNLLNLQFEIGQEFQDILNLNTINTIKPRKLSKNDLNQ
ncbi:hypothetical protein ABPG74_020262 [Tetrahymena malaccensis]